MKITSTIIIHNSTDVVFAWVSNPDKFIRWQNTVKGIRNAIASEDGTAITFEYLYEVNYLPITAKARIGRIKKNEYVEYIIEDIIQRMSAKYILKGEENSTIIKADISYCWKPPLLLSILRNWSGNKKLLEDQLVIEMNTLKRICEGKT